MISQLTQWSRRRYIYIVFPFIPCSLALNNARLPTQKRFESLKPIDETFLLLHSLQKNIYLLLQHICAYFITFCSSLHLILLFEKIQEPSKVLVFKAYSKAVFFETLCFLRKKYALLLALKTQSLQKSDAFFQKVKLNGSVINE